MPDLQTSVQYIKGVGAQRARALARLGIHTLGDLLEYFPRAYEDRTVVRPIGELIPQETACVRAMVAGEPRLTHVRRGLDLVKLQAVDETGRLSITFFNQSYVKDQLRPGETYVFYGRVEGSLLRKSLTNPVFEREDRAGTVTGRILPLYRLTAGVSNRVLAGAVEAGLDLCGDILPEILPESVRRRYGLAQAGFALRTIHFPPDFAQLAIARRRLVFQELFVLSCALGRFRRDREQAPGLRLRSPDPEEFYATLPYSPTGAQRRAVREALADMAGGGSMNRLIQGDVGCGKTLVAAACVWGAWKSGYQSAFMAPTEILARQHQHTLAGLLEPLGLKVGLLLGSLTPRQKREVKAAAESGEYDLLIGTHALLSGDLAFRRLGLVVTDEQHRFGVEQRSALWEKGGRPHVLVMSATPIPRTLALMIYGDLDVSVIDELPPGRQKVDTFVVDSSYRERLNGFIRRQAEAGHPVFVVCPMVEENEDLPGDLKSAEEHAAVLREQFPDLRVGCVHGKMKPRDKEAAMAAMASGETDILVATTVVEVGVDIPRATLMVVENAERFGLSQLHQLRGRVGRGSHRSWCVLVSDATSPEARARLQVMASTSDGFAVAEEDLKLRGPGDFFGSRQHGLPAMHIADLRGDMQVLTQAREAADALMAEDPALERPENAPLRAHILRLFQQTAGTFN